MKIHKYIEKKWKDIVIGVPFIIAVWGSVFYVLYKLIFIL